MIVESPSLVSAIPAPVALEDGLRKWRIEKTIDDPFEFGRIYFPKYWFQKSPAFHQDIINLATHQNEKEWEGKMNLNTLVLAAPRNHSKCIKYDTKILLSNGSSISIQDIQVGEKIISLNESTLKFEHDEIVAKTESGIKNLIKIKTKTSKIISMTMDHKVLTFDGWKLAGDLTLSDKIASPRSVPNLVAMQFKTREELRLMAYLIAEGSLTTPTAIRFTNADDDVVNDFKQCASLMGFKISHIAGITWSIKTGSKAPLEWTRSLNLQGHSALNKLFPDWVFELPSEQKWEIIDALMVTDGYFATVARQGGIGLANEKLIDQIKELFMHVGVISTKRYMRNDKAGAWVLLFGSESVELMLKHCGLMQKRKSAELIVAGSTSGRSYTDNYAPSLQKNIGHSEWFRDNGCRIDVAYCMTRKKIQKIISLIKSSINCPIPEHTLSRLETLEKADVFWDSIVEISEDKSALTFDVETKTNHNLVTNGIVTHNSTLISFLYVIWSLVTQRKFFVVIISDIARISTSHSRNIKEELESNDRLRNDWGIVLGKDWDEIDGSVRGEKEKWTDEEFVIGFKKWDKSRNMWSGELEDRAKVLARMANNPLRGLRFGHRRPDLVIADDLENDELVDTSIQREKLANWWDSAVEPMIEPPPVGQIILVGTVLHYGSLLNKMLQRTDLYVTRRYQAVTSVTNEQGEKVQSPLWPERFSLERLSSLKAKNVLAFQKEYMNDPRDDTTRTFRSSWIQWYDAHDIGYRPSNKRWYFRGKQMTFFTGVDWTVGKDDQSDFFSIIMVGKTIDNDIVIFDIVNEKMDVANQINRLIMQNQSYTIQMNGVEGNGFQHVLIQQVLRKSLVPIREIRHLSRKRKQIRIEGMSTLFEQGKIYLRKCTESEISKDELTNEPSAENGFYYDETRSVVVHPEFWNFYEQLMTYPRSENDDMLDAMEMSLEVSKNGRRAFEEVLLI